MTIDAFLALLLQTIKDFGGLSWMLKIAGIVLLVIASMKVSVLNDLVWSKLGAFKVWLAPILGLIAGVLSLGSDMSIHGVLAYISAGAGAVLLAEILDTVKAIPGIGPMYVQGINIIESFLGGPASK